MVILWQLLCTLDAHNTGALGHMTHLQMSVIDFVLYDYGTFTSAQSYARATGRLDEDGDRGRDGSPVDAKSA